MFQQKRWNNGQRIFLTLLTSLSFNAITLSEFMADFILKTLFRNKLKRDSTRRKIKKNKESQISEKIANTEPQPKFTGSDKIVYPSRYFCCYSCFSFIIDFDVTSERRILSLWSSYAVVGSKSPKSDCTLRSSTAS